MILTTLNLTFQLWMPIWITILCVFYHRQSPGKDWYELKPSFLLLPCPVIDKHIVGVGWIVQGRGIWTRSWKTLGFFQTGSGDRRIPNRMNSMCKLKGVKWASLLWLDGINTAQLLIVRWRGKPGSGFVWTFSCRLGSHHHICKQGRDVKFLWWRKNWLGEVRKGRRHRAGTADVFPLEYK